MDYIEWCGFKAHLDNVPEPRAGVYVAKCLANGKYYVGESINIEKRLLSHAAGRSPHKFRNALNKYGTRNFLITPVWYASGIELDKYYQLAVETQFIVDLDSVENGYNVLKNYHQGLYGKEWGDYLKTFWTEDLRLQQSRITREQFLDPKRRKKQSEAVTKYFTDNPDEAGRYFRTWWLEISVEDKALFLAAREPARLASIREFFADPERVARWSAKVNTPETVAKRNAAIREAYQNPEVIARHAAAVADPKARKKLSNSLTDYFSDPKNRERARQALINVADKHSESLRSAWERNPRIWITDGTKSTQHFANTPIPDGWVRGRADAFGRKLPLRRVRL